jgi:hypothetical protein
MEHDYRYAASSTVTAGDVLLATSGGCTSAGPAAAPRFFSGFLEHPGQAAACLLAVARVARTRFYVPPGMVAAILRAADPVVTSNGDRLRFESFSACCGVHVRFDALEGSLDGPALNTGTTNVDFNPPMREALARIGGGDPIRLEVGLDDVTVTTLDTSVVEKKVPLPERWLKGFAEVQVATARMAPRLETNAVEARRFIGSLPRQPSRAGATWVSPATNGLRLSTQPAAGAVPLPGPERLKPFEPLLRFARRLRVYSAEGQTGSAWEIELADARIVVTLSPDVRRGFSGEGGVLDDLADDQATEDADLVSVLLSWEPRLDVDLLAGRAGISPARVVRALTHLSAAGRVGYDLAEAGYFHRELPYDPAVLAAMHPRLRDAQALVEQGAVQWQADGTALVSSGDLTYRVRAVDGDLRCTCPWWGRHQGDRGPCKHALAADLVRRSAGA